MTDPSSADALKDSDKHGGRARQHKLIHAYLLARGDMTSAEYCQMTGSNAGKKIISQSRARFTELGYAGKLDRLPRRKCRVTGRKATVWHACPAPWIARAKPLTRKRAIRLMNAALEEQARERTLREDAEREVVRLKAQVAELKAEVSSLSGVKKK